MNIEIASLWSNDAKLDLTARIEHLLSKKSAFDNVSWLWIVGDSYDMTEKILRMHAGSNPRVRVVRCDTGIVGTDIDTRRARLAATATLAFRHISPHADVVCSHESDLRSPVFVVDRLASSWPCAGWPTININRQERFYDVWAYRDLNGDHFSAMPPYSPEYCSVSRFEVSSFGSVWTAPAGLVRRRTIGPLCIVDLCRQWRKEGLELLVDPTVKIEQPVHLWEVR